MINLVIGIVAICFGMILILNRTKVLADLVKFQSEAFHYEYGSLQKKGSKIIIVVVGSLFVVFGIYRILV